MQLKNIGCSKKIEIWMSNTQNYSLTKNQLEMSQKFRKILLWRII